MAKALLPLLILLAGIAECVTSSPEAASAAAKLALVRNGRVTPGSNIVFTAREINAYAAARLPEYFPRGLRNARVELGNGSATGTALVDFVKVRQVAGQSTNWVLAKLIEGERPLKVITSIQSAHGRATVYLRSVEISGIAISGSALDFLIDNFLKPVFPDILINESFPLVDNVERVEARPGELRAVIKAQVTKPAAPTPLVHAAKPK